MSINTYLNTIRMGADIFPNDSGAVTFLPFIGKVHEGAAQPTGTFSLGKESPHRQPPTRLTSRFVPLPRLRGGLPSLVRISLAIRKFL